MVNRLDVRLGLRSDDERQTHEPPSNIPSTSRQGLPTPRGPLGLRTAFPEFLKVPCGYLCRIDLVRQTIPDLFNEFQSLADAELAKPQRFKTDSQRYASHHHGRLR
jgi:hypothetical protein